MTDNINDPDAVSEVKKVISNSIERLTTRVLTAIDSFKGYSHAIVIGGGAPLVADAIRERMGLREDRFCGGRRAAVRPRAWSEKLLVKERL